METKKDNSEPALGTSKKEKRRQPRKSPMTIVVIIGFLFIYNPLFAQLFCETSPATTGSVDAQSSNRLMDAIIIGVAIMIVLFTLIMSIKYLFKPGEKDPHHIKNIVKDEGF